MKAYLLVLLSLLFVWRTVAADTTTDNPLAGADETQAEQSEVVDAVSEEPGNVEGWLEDSQQDDRVAELDVSELNIGETAVIPHAADCGCYRCYESEGADCCPSGLLEFHGPLAVKNQHPTTALFLTPLPAGATVLTDGEASLQVRLDLTNNIIRELDNGIVVDLDFETLRTTLDYRRGIAGGELSVEVPLISRTHGFLDGLISDWHGWFGLGNGLRNTFPDNQYRYTIISRQGPVYNGSGDVFGVGDIALTFKQPVFERANGSAMAWRAGIKLPAGQADKALGSGGLDLQLGGIYEHQISERWKGYANLDYIWIGTPDWDNIGHQDVIASLWALEYAVDSDTTVVGQYRTHRNPLRVGSREADKDAQELGLGFHHRLDDNLLWTGGFSEDIAPETAPDFVVMSHFLWEL